LKHFEYRDFDDKFLANLEKEISLAVEHTKKNLTGIVLKKLTTLKLESIEKLREGN